MTPPPLFIRVKLCLPPPHQPLPNGSVQQISSKFLQCDNECEQIHGQHTRHEPRVHWLSKFGNDFEC